MASIRVVDHTSEYKHAMNAAVARALDTVGGHLEGEAKDELENSPRRVDTARLKNSITYKVNDNSVIVGTNVNYAIYVHEGTRRMTPNRFLRNAFERNEEQIVKFIENELKNAMK